MRATIDELRSLSSQIDDFFDLGNSEAAEALLSKALIDSADNSAYQLFFLAEVAGYLERDRKKQKENLLQAYRQNENDPFIVRNVGVYFLLDNSERKAIRFFEKALALDPADFAAARHIGLAFSNLGREKSAMEWFARAISLNPLDYDALRQSGVSLSKLGKDREAVEWYKKALAVNEKDYDAMRQLGVSLAMLGKFEAACTWLNLALVIKPTDFETQRNLKLLLKKMTGEGETILTRLLNRLGRKIGTLLRGLLSTLVNH
jgi:tetratricopeptide (TPR) repeat protein